MSKMTYQTLLDIILETIEAAPAAKAEELHEAFEQYRNDFPRSFQSLEKDTTLMAIRCKAAELFLS